jgi:CHAD domain-containing protein
MARPAHGRPDADLDPAAPAGDVYRHVLTSLADAFDANVCGTLTDADPEHLHELRVSVRRTRSVLAESKRVLPGGVRRRQRRFFGELADVTGPARDLDVYVFGWDALVADLGTSREVLDPVVAELEVRRVAAHVLLDDHLQDRRTRQSLGRWRRWLADPDDLGKLATAPVGPLVGKRVERAHQQVLRRGRAISPSSPAEDLHELRKDAKVLRYLLECFGGLYERRPRKAFVARLKALQDNLGEHQDAEVQSAQLRRLARELHGDAAAPDVLLALGGLTELLDQRQRAARRTFDEHFAAYEAGAAGSSAGKVLLPRVG